MSFELNSFLTKKQSVNEILRCNDFTGDYGLILTQEQAMALVETRSHALKMMGRIEFGSGIIGKMIKEFCGSPYITPHSYTRMMHELIEIFYYYKGETLDLISDDALIKFMHRSFDGACEGSLELLFGRELEKLARDLRGGISLNDSKEALEKEAEDDDNEEN